MGAPCDKRTHLTLAGRPIQAYPITLCSAEQRAGRQIINDAQRANFRTSSSYKRAV